MVEAQQELLVQKTVYNNYSLLLFWCPYMVINVSVQCNGGLLPDIILFFYFSERAARRGGGGVRCQTFSFSFFPC